MKPHRRMLAILFLITLWVSIQGAYGIQLSVTGGGDGQETGSVFLDIRAATDAIVTSRFSLDGANIVPAIVINGVVSFEEVHQVTDSTGKHAEVKVKVVNGLNPEYSSIVLPGEGNVPASSYVSAEQFLTVTDADQIFCSAAASNSIGAKTSVGTEINKGSLIGYTSKAIAKKDSATAYQSFDSASSEYHTSFGITLSSEASNKEGDNAKMQLLAQKWVDGLASLNSYYGTATATRTRSTVKGDLNAEDGDTQVNSDAHNAEGDHVHFYLENFNSLNGYSISATASKNYATASQIADSATCAAFYSDGLAENAEGDVAELRLGLQGSATPPLNTPVHGSASINEYKGELKASKNSATASQTLDFGSGAAFHSWGSSYNREGDYSRASADIWFSRWDLPLFSLNGYYTKATAKRQKAEVSEGILSASAFDYWFDLGIEGVHSKNDALGEPMLCSRSYGRSFLEKGKLDAYSASASASPSGTMAAQTKIRGIGDKLEVWSEAENVELGLHVVSNDERSDEKSKYSTSASTKSGKRGNAKASVKYLGGYR